MTRKTSPNRMTADAMERVEDSSPVKRETDSMFTRKRITEFDVTTDSIQVN